ncbi:MAG: YdeI/OmpD-associated family protein [bacterium]|nr:YdeI/OmpD-associated family protein [bacterium]
MRERTLHFTATVLSQNGRTFLPLPEEVVDRWGEKPHHYVAGVISGRTVRGRTEARLGRYILPLGPTWLRDNDIQEGMSVQCALELESPVLEELAPDIVSAFEAEPQAKAFFEEIAPFYRKNYLRWIESAKRPQTRAKRIEEVVRLLKEGRRQR